MAGGARNLTGGVPITQHKANKSNIEQAENEAAAERRQKGKQHFPKCLHKAGGLEKIVHTEDELTAALGKGWFDDIRDVPVTAPTHVPELVSQMTLLQAATAIATASAEQLAAMNTDERSHGNRAAVLSLLDEAMDNAGPSAAKPAKAAKPKKAGKK